MKQLALVLVLLIVVISACGNNINTAESNASSSYSTQIPIPTPSPTPGNPVGGYLHTFSNAVDFLQITVNGSQITGTEIETIFSPKYMTVSASISGSINGSQVTLNLPSYDSYGVLAGTYSESGTFDGTNITLAVIQKDGTVYNAVYTPATTTEYNNAINAFRSNIATATAYVQQRTCYVGVQDHVAVAQFTGSDYTTQCNNFIQIHPNEYIPVQSLPSNIDEVKVCSGSIGNSNFTVWDDNYSYQTYGKEICKELGISVN